MTILGDVSQTETLPPCAVTAISDIIGGMAAITIRQLDENIKNRLRLRAAHHGRSMEAEAREILRSALGAALPVKGNLAERIRQRFAPFGGVKLKLPRRDPIRKPPDFSHDRSGK
jgi:plasmid stability protein